MDVGYGPITIKEELSPEAFAQEQDKHAEVVVAEIEDFEWYETTEGANNVVLMAVGGSLIFAIIVLGVVIGVYVQFQNQTKEKQKGKIEDKSKVKDFMQTVMKEGAGEKANPAFVRNE